MMLIQPSARAQCDPQEVAKLLTSDGAANDFVGLSTSISGDTAVVGAYGDDDLGSSAGSAYVFQKVGGAWMQKTKLLASDGASGDWFGYCVAISGDAVVVGARFDDDLGGDSGSAYVFEKIDNVWTQTAKLLASDGAPGDYFGEQVSISGDTAIVGAGGNDSLGTNSGSAYLFEKIGGVWTQTAKLLASDGAPDDRFGDSIAISGETAIVGAYGDHDLGSFSGSAYVFENIGGVWIQTAKLLASDGGYADYFGVGVAIEGDTAIVGADSDDDLGSDSGSAYVFEKTGGVWTQTAKLLASDGAPDDRFGDSIAISGETAIVGALRHGDSGPESGSAYLYQKIGGVWTQTAKLRAADGGGGDWFGSSVSISGDTAIAGASGDDNRGVDSGSAYVFDLNCAVRLTVNATCPTGGPIQVSWSGATPNGQIALIFARNEGSFIVPNNLPCAGTQLGLSGSQIQVAYRGSAGADGSRTVNATAGPAACGGNLQLLDLSTCGTSNVTAIQ